MNKKNLIFDRTESSLSIALKLKVVRHEILVGSK